MAEFYTFWIDEKYILTDFAIMEAKLNSCIL